MKEKTNKYLIAALVLGLLFHGASMFFTLENTYDALIHLFFAEHYANNWFDAWNYKWYTGFTVMGYPPLVHQVMALFSWLGGLHFGLFAVALCAVVLFITGVYRFSLLLTGNRKVAGYAALIGVFSSTFIETLHIFGQLPSIVGVSLLMHALPEIYLWVKQGKYKYLWRALSLVAVTVSSHHVTPIFGMVFFIFPLLGMAVMDKAYDRAGSYKNIRFDLFWQSFLNLFKRILIFGLSALVLIIVCILPYWINTKQNPITQVAIPHGSRDNFLEVSSSGLVFFLIPWGIALFLMPYLFYRFFAKRYLFFGLSFAALGLLGTGGTTPIPKLLLGETAFNILTLDRFTLWAALMGLPILGEFAYRFIETDLKQKIQRKYGAVLHRLLGGILVAGISFFAIFTITLSYFRPMQPQKINMLPIVNFLNQDQHDQWRYLTLGFGDQMAWLSAQTNALSVDGNYHSARRLPELTTRAVERLENSKFRGIEGLGSLQQFLTVPDKYNLKYIFSNDKFYDPLLYFSGWQRLQRLENGIMVWERLNVAPLSKILPRPTTALWLRLMWGVIPLLTVLVAFIFNFQVVWYQTLKLKKTSTPDFLKYPILYRNFESKISTILHYWLVFMCIVISYAGYLFYVQNTDQLSPKNVVTAYYDALDFKAFEKAHAFLNPENAQDINQFMLEVSVTDGVLSSYAKVEAIEVEVIKKTDKNAEVLAHLKYVTPLQNIKKTYLHQLVKSNGKWYLEPKKLDNDLPPNQFFSQNTTHFYNHGRRRITTQQTYHEDVLEQPRIKILTAKLVRHNNQYAIIGTLQNKDHIPADVVLKGKLYNERNEVIASYNAKYAVKHKLLPKESTMFRIDFEGIAWLLPDESIPETFNPDEFTPIDLKETPVSFSLHCGSNVATTDLYKGLSLASSRVQGGSVHGRLFNHGTKEITIPQIIMGYYNKNKELIWVEHKFLEDGIRVQRKLDFNYTFSALNDIQVVQSSTDNCFVNGLQNKSNSHSFNALKSSGLTMNLQPVKDKNFNYFSIQLNSFIGNLK